MLNKIFENPGQMLFFGGIALATWVLMRRLFVHRRKDAKRVDSIKELAKKERPVQSVDAPVDAVRWEVRLHDIGREISAKIDCKISALMAMTKLAHEAAERLEIATVNAAEVETQRYGSSTLDGVERRLHEATFEVGEFVELETREPQAKPVDAVESLRRVVRRLLANGLSAAEISAQTEMPLGEVEFLASTLAVKKPQAA